MLSCGTDSEDANHTFLGLDLCDICYLSLMDSEHIKYSLSHHGIARKMIYNSEDF